MNKELTEEYIKENCPHCDLSSQTYQYLLEQTNSFIVVADPHPLAEGHVLIIPKQHISCIGEYPITLWKEFVDLYKKLNDFVLKEYGSVSSFEHGKVGQTVFHSHLHILPFDGQIENIVPEGKDKIKKITSLEDLKEEFFKEGQYLFFSIAKKLLLVDTAIGAPRFFRDRYAEALGVPERGNWKTMHEDSALMKKAEMENGNVKGCWLASRETSI